MITLNKEQVLMLHALHTFREGNRRSQRAFDEEILETSIDSLNKGDKTKLEAIFHKCIMSLI